MPGRQFTAFRKYPALSSQRIFHVLRKPRPALPVTKKPSPNIPLTRAPDRPLDVDLIARRLEWAPEGEFLPRLHVRTEELGSVL